MVLALIITNACNPMDEIYDEMDSPDQTVVGDATYILSDEDYEELGLTFGSFNSVDEAKEKIPGLLTDLYPVWGKGSSVLAGYQLYIGAAEGVSDYTGAASYTLNEADYATSGSDVLGFYPDINPADYLPAILASNISAPIEGQIALAKYIQYTEVPVVESSYTAFSEDFDYGTTAGDLTTITTEWVAHANVGVGLAGYATSSLSMANYPNSAIGGAVTIAASGAEDVSSVFTPITSGKIYASALVNLSAVSSGTYFFHFMDDTFGYSARVGAKDNGAGKISFGIGASSSTLTYGATAFDLNTTYLLVSSYDIASGASNLYVLTTAVATEPAAPEASSTGNPGLTVQKIGIRQGGGGPTGTIDGVRVATGWKSIMSNDVADIVTGAKIFAEGYYSFTNGSWKLPTGMYSLTAEDYDSMGTASGQPGRYNNFDGSMDIDNYISTFLGLKYPYAKDEDALIVIYKYYSSSAGATQTRGNEYTVIDGVWTGHQSTISTTLQFGHDGTIWVPDNTIKYTLVGADYDFIVATYSSKYPAQCANMASYGNFNGFSWTHEMIVEVIGGVLLNNNPSAAEGQKYAATYSIYDGSTHDDTVKLTLTGGVYVED